MDLLCSLSPSHLLGEKKWKIPLVSVCLVIKIIEFVERISSLEASSMNTISVIYICYISGTRHKEIFFLGMCKMIRE